jgi:hypothetical protein
VKTEAAADLGLPSIRGRSELKPGEKTVAVKTKRARVKLNKGVRIAGKHYDKGTTLEVDPVLASDMVAGNQAEFVQDNRGEEDGRDVEEKEQLGVRIEKPQHGDPGPREIKNRSPKS